MTTVRFDPVDSVQGRLRAPADKSISHRGLLLGAFADGRSTVSGCLDAADTRSTLAAIESLGAEVSSTRSDSGALDLEILGFGLRGASPCDIDVGNSGTLIRLLMGLLASQPAGGEWTLEGDRSIAGRPMDRVADPLARLGAEIECRDGAYAPVTVHGSQIHGGEVSLGVASAQVKSAVLLAGLGATAPVTVTEPSLSRDHTELMLAYCGVGVSREGPATTVSPAEHLGQIDLRVPGDISSAAFSIVAALILPGSQLLLPEIGLNPTRTGILDIVNSMSTSDAVTCSAESVSAGERLGNLEVASADLSGIRVEGDLIPRAIDELPLLALLGCFADGETVLTDAGELRVKESDRIEGVVAGLAGLGAEIEELPDGFRVVGAGGIAGGVLDARGDHRLAMLGAVAGLVSREGVEVKGFEAVDISYPNFESDIRSITTG